MRIILPLLFVFTFSGNLLFAQSHRQFQARMMRQKHEKRHVGYQSVNYPNEIVAQLPQFGSLNGMGSFMGGGRVQRHFLQDGKLAVGLGCLGFVATDNLGENWDVRKETVASRFFLSAGRLCFSERQQQACCTLPWRCRNCWQRKNSVRLQSAFRKYRTSGMAAGCLWRRRQRRHCNLRKAGAAFCLWFQF